MNLTVAGTADAINMVEAGANELSEDEMLEAMMVAHAEIKEICGFIQTIIDDIGKEKMEVCEEVETELQRKIKDKYTQDIKNSIRTTDKVQREDDINEIEEKCREDFLEEFPESEDEIHKTVDSIMKKKLEE